MTLKEAFRYQNFLTMIFDSVLCNLNHSNACSITETHLRSKENPDAGDEKIDKTPKRAFDCKVDQLICLANFLIDEKDRLSRAIAETKYRNCQFMDADTSVNAARRQLQTKLSSICRCKPEITEASGTAYRFNVEGNQVPYTYKVIREIALDFDKPAAKEMSRNLAKQADEVSASIDRLMTTVDVSACTGFIPAFDPSDSLDDVIVAYLDRLSCDEAE